MDHNNHQNEGVFVTCIIQDQLHNYDVDVLMHIVEEQQTHSLEYIIFFRLKKF